MRTVLTGADAGVLGDVTTYLKTEGEFLITTAFSTFDYRAIHR